MLPMIKVFGPRYGNSHASFNICNDLQKTTSVRFAVSQMLALFEFRVTEWLPIFGLSMDPD